jgi:hypothetical protein
VFSPENKRWGIRRTHLSFWCIINSHSGFSQRSQCYF